MDITPADGGAPAVGVLSSQKNLAVGGVDVQGTTAADHAAECRGHGVGCQTVQTQVHRACDAHVVGPFAHRGVEPQARSVGQGHRASTQGVVVAEAHGARANGGVAHEAVGGQQVEAAFTSFGEVTGAGDAAAVAQGFAAGHIHGAAADQDDAALAVQGEAVGGQQGAASQGDGVADQVRGRSTQVTVSGDRQGAAPDVDLALVAMIAVGDHGPCETAGDDGHRHVAAVGQDTGLTKVACHRPFGGIRPEVAIAAHPSGRGQLGDGACGVLVQGEGVV